MKHLKTFAAPVALPLAFVLAVVAMPALASSTTSSAASDSASSTASSGSESLKKSSDGSSKTTTAVAPGDYEVVDVATVAERPGVVRMLLQAVADRSADGEFFLYVPQQVAERTQLAAGQVVAARQRPYGVEFAKADTAFFLVLSDDWYRELQSNVVVL